MIQRITSSVSQRLFGVVWLPCALPLPCLPENFELSNKDARGQFRLVTLFRSLSV